MDSAEGNRTDSAITENEPVYTPVEAPLHTGVNAAADSGPTQQPLAAQPSRESEKRVSNTISSTSTDPVTVGDTDAREKAARRVFIRSATNSPKATQSDGHGMERAPTQTKLMLPQLSDASSTEEYRKNTSDSLKGSSAQKSRARNTEKLSIKTADLPPRSSKPANFQRTASDFDIFRENDLDDEDGEDNASVDSCGLPRYIVRYPANTGRHGKPPKSSHVSGDLSVPWYLRKPGGRPFQCTFFNFLREPKFWRLFEFATRITAIAVLVPSALIAARLEHNPFVSPYAVISAVILASKGNVGEAIAYFFVWVRAGCLWLPLSVIGGAIGLGNHIAGWCVYYAVILFVMAVFTEAMPRRICLLLFNSCLVGLLVDPTRGATYACRVMGDWCIGTGLCLVAAFFPYPIFCKKEAQRLLNEIAKNTATAFRGLVYSFWSPTNVERNMAMSKVRIMTESLDSLLIAFEHSQEFSFFEFLFESAEVRELRHLKFHFFERLRVNLRSMTRVLDMVERTPSAIDDSDRSQAFGQLLMPHLNNVAEAFDELMDLLVSAKTKKAILSLDEYFDNLRQHTEELQEAYRLARRVLFYEQASVILEEFVPLMTFYLFTVVCFRDTVDICEVKVRGFKSGARTTITAVLKKTAWNPFMENVTFVKTLFKKRNRREVQRVIEALKVSAAMILTIGFSYLIRVDKASFSGPNIIAFVSGMNPVEALQASIVRLTGCLIGTVLGFFAGTYSETPVQRVASLCTLMFCGTFLRTDKEFGIMSVYAMFVLVPLDSVVPTTIEDTVARMNQNTFGIFIYLFVSILVLPLSPSLILRAKRANVLRRMSMCLSNMMWLFSIPTVSELGTRVFSFENIKDFGLTASNAATDEADSDDVEMPDREHLPPKVSNTSINMVLRTDTPMEELNSQLRDIIKRLKGTKEFMGFARDERGLVTVDYPVKECQATYLHMYHMTFLLKTMWLSWNVMRSQRRYTRETRRMLHNLQPVARDVASAFDKLSELLTYMMKDPSVNLESELMRAELDLISSASELHTRKSQIMLMLINTSVAEYREGVAALSDREGFSPPGCPVGNDNSESSAVEGDDEVLNGNRPPRHVTQRPPFSRMSDHSQRPPRRPDGQTFEVTFSDRILPHYEEHRFTPNTRGAPGCLPHAATFDGPVSDWIPGGAQPNRTPLMSPNTQTSPHYGNFRVVASERNVSILPYIRRTGATPTGAAPEGPVRLPAEFVFPVTSEDAEGMHSFTLSLEMFANETKMLTLSLAVMLDHLRSKL